MPEQAVLESAKDLNDSLSSDGKTVPCLSKYSVPPLSTHVRPWRAYSVEIILFDDIGFRLDHPVVPDCQDRACQIIAALQLVVDAAVVEGEEVGKRCRNGSDSGNGSRSPESLSGLFLGSSTDASCRSLPACSTIPDSRRSPFSPWSGHKRHFGYEIRIGELHLVCPDMQVRDIERFANLVDQEFQYLHPFWLCMSWRKVRTKAALCPGMSISGISRT